MSGAYDTAAIAATRAAIQRARDAANLLVPDDAWQRLCRDVDPAAAIRGLGAERLTGAAAEASTELMKRRPAQSGNSVRIPWETLAFRAARYAAQRADTVGAAGTGATLVQTQNFNNAAQALMSMLVLGRLGATAVDSNGPNLNLPKVNDSATPYWLSTEATQVTESDQTYGQLAFTPHTVGGYTEMSRLLMIQSTPSAGDVVANDLARRIGREIEKQALAGTGVAGQPKGLTTFTGVNAVSGATYALATGMGAATATGDALTDDAAPGWAANRNVASLLRQRQEFSGSSLTLWRGALTAGQLHDFPAFSTSGVAAGTAFFGNWRYLVLVDFAGGLEISVNPFDPTNFKNAIVGMRCFSTIDVAPVWPAAFTAVTGIT